MSGDYSTGFCKVCGAVLPSMRRKDSMCDACRKRARKELAQAAKHTRRREEP